MSAAPTAPVTDCSTPRDAEADVVVVGFGAAGSCAAIEARSHGADVPGHRPLWWRRCDGPRAARRHPVRGRIRLQSGHDAEVRPVFAASMPIGTVGDDGSGIELGQSVGGAVGQMDRCSAWRFINPPEAFTYGILVDAHGQRICNEELYGATLGERIAERAQGCGYLVIDATMAAQAREQIRRQKGARFQKLSTFVNLFLNRKTAATLAELATCCGLPAEAFVSTVEAYNGLALQGGVDPFGKAEALCRPIRTPPFYAINCDLENARFQTPGLTLGGLRVNGASGQVLRQDGSPIAGLYAAGRNAAGIASHSYVSGLSISDCIFSGRTAGCSALL